jgi:predicted dehydrogenase
MSAQAPAQRRLRVAVIGLGWWGRVVVPLASASPRLDLVCVADPSAATEAFAKTHQLPWHDDLRKVLADPQIEGVILCTPHTLHCEQIIAAAQAGKHVFCEKPLSLTRADAERAIAACQAHGVALAVGHERRFEPPVIEAMRLLKSGALGTPLQVEANFSQDKFLTLPGDNWRMTQREAPAGPLTATGVHLLDLSVGVFGEAERVFADVRQLGSHLSNGDTLAILAQFRGGGHALISAILATPFDGRFAIYGSRGWVEVRDKAHPEAPQGWTLTTCLRGEPRAVREFAPAPAVLRNLEAFAAAALGETAYPVPPEQMLANIALLEAVIRSSAAGTVQAVER